MKVSETESPSFVKNFINHSGKAIGKTALRFLSPHSAARWRTFVGYTLVLLRLNCKI